MLLAGSFFRPVGPEQGEGLHAGLGPLGPAAVRFM